MRILLLGANGQVGSELKRSLLPLGYVISLDRSGCDLARPHTIPPVLREAKADVVVNAAAYTAVNAYGRSKLGGEVAIREAGGDHLILRTSWVFAARGRNFLTAILRLARERDELRIVADQLGAPTWARDIADATAHVIRQAQRERKQGDFTPDLVHMTAAGATSWHGFAQAILGQAGDLVPARPALLPITSEEYVTPARRPKSSRLCCDRLRERFGVVLPEWEAGLAQCFDHSKKSHHALA